MTVVSHNCSKFDEVLPTAIISGLYKNSYFLKSLWNTAVLWQSPKGSGN